MKRRRTNKQPWLSAIALEVATLLAIITVARPMWIPDVLECLGAAQHNLLKNLLYTPNVDQVSEA